MRLIVTDANIFIDRAAGGLLESMFALDIEFAVPDVLYLEELQDNFVHLPALGLRILSMPPDTIANAEALGVRYPKPSQNDIFALTLARELDCTLLTGDKHLRTAAEEETVRVHGALWLIEQIYTELRLEIGVIEKAYDLMRNDGSRLPWDEVRQQLRRLGKDN